MENLPTIKTTLCLSADLFDLDLITEKMGIKPTKTRTKDSFPSYGLPHTVWTIEVFEKECWAISAPLEKLFKILEGKAKTIKFLCEEYELEAIIVITIHMNHGERPEMDIPREFISFAGFINAEIGFDLYCYE